MKRSISLLLSLAMLAGLFSGCGKAIDNSAYVPTGDALVLEGQDPEDIMPVEEEANQLLNQTIEAYLKKHKPVDKNSTIQMWEIREQAQRIAEEVVMTEVVNKYH